MIEITNVLNDFPHNRRFCEAVVRSLIEKGRLPEIIQESKNGNSYIQVIDHCTPEYERGFNNTSMDRRIVAFRSEPIPA